MISEQRIGVVIPAFNEASAIGRVLQAIPSFVDQIVVVDNGSTDQTAEVAILHGATVVQEPVRGYGRACLTGMRTLSAVDIVFFLDGDNSDFPEEMPDLLAPILCNQADMVIGSRTLGKPEPGSLTLVQQFGNRLACMLMWMFFGTNHTDLGPFRAIRWKTLQRLHMTDTTYGWTVQMQVRAAKHKVRVSEVPVHYRRRIGTSKISGTLRGVLGAGWKIIGTILYEACVRNLPKNEKQDRLIVFARYPTPGQTKTRLIPLLGDQGAALLHKQLAAMTLQTAQSLIAFRDYALEVRSTGETIDKMSQWMGRDLCIVDQGDGDLGNRLAKATNDAFTNGNRKVVLIGTDCPSMQSTHLDNAFDSLERHDLVVGPANDGGYYLIGMNDNYQSLFHDIPWGGPDVLSCTLTRARELRLKVHQLPVLSDIDVPTDLAKPLNPCGDPDSHQPLISVIIPTLNEESHLAATLMSVTGSPGIEVIIVDAHSTDRTVSIARQFGVKVILTEPSRGGQLHTGAQVARGKHLLFLHADTRLPAGYCHEVCAILQLSKTAAGAFDLKIDDPNPMYRFIESGIRLRSRWLGRPYGDQALFMTADTYQATGGFPALPCMEDFAMIPELKRIGRIRISRKSVTTSARSWKRNGILSTTAKNQWMKLQYYLNHGSAVTKLRRAWK